MGLGFDNYKKSYLIAVSGLKPIFELILLDVEVNEESFFKDFQPSWRRTFKIETYKIGNWVVSRWWKFLPKAIQSGKIASIPSDVLRS